LLARGHPVNTLPEVDGGREVPHLVALDVTEEVPAKVESAIAGGLRLGCQCARVVLPYVDEPGRGGRLDRFEPVLLGHGHDRDAVGVTARAGDAVTDVSQALAQLHSTRACRSLSPLARCE